MKTLKPIKNALIDTADGLGIFCLVAGIVIGNFYPILLGASFIAIGKVMYDDKLDEL